MKLPDPPDGLIAIPYAKAMLLFTAREFTAAVRRGKWWRRRQQELARVGARQDGVESTISEQGISP